VLGDFEAFAEMFVIQPAAARMCLVDVYAAGPEAVERVERSREGFQRLAHEALRQSPERAAMPAEMIRAYMGAMQEITRTRLLRGTEDELASLMPQLWKMMLDYRPPPQPLRLAVRSQVPGPGPEGFDAHDHAERALRALTAVVAEQGYAETTITDVVKRASMSRTTFYSLFADKEDALLCAIDSGGAQLVAAVAPAVRRAPDWAHGIRAGFGALLSYLAHHPAFARLVAVEVFAAGLAAVERRAEAVAPLEELLAKGYERSPDTPPIAVEAIAGGVHTLIYEQIRRAGPQSLPELAPLCTYIALAPFIGAQEACEVANSSGRRVRGSD
jgi:AcrR family transcriptional regulator